MSAPRLGLRREDAIVELVEVPIEKWSFENVEAQYA
jgi:hypothetical protein